MKRKDLGEGNASIAVDPDGGTISLVSGERKTAGLMATEKGISLNGDSIFIQQNVDKRPLFMKNPIPFADVIPRIVNPMPSCLPDIPFLPLLPQLPVIVAASVALIAIGQSTKKAGE